LIVVIALGIVVVAAGFVLVWVAVAGWRGRLSRNWVAGVRTFSTMRSDAAFAVANKAAAPLGVAGGLVMALGGVLALVVPKHAFGIPLFSGVVIGTRCASWARSSASGRPSSC
jgi:uncharacterized membrane protein